MTNRISLDRPMPSATDAELALLCATLVAPGRVLTEVADVKPEHFYDSRAQALWRIIRALHGEGKAVDPVTISARFDEARADELRAFLSTPLGSQFAHVSHWRGATCCLRAPDSWASGRDLPFTGAWSIPPWGLPYLKRGQSDRHHTDEDDGSREVLPARRKDLV